jgi:hypothetical protein
MSLMSARNHKTLERQTALVMGATSGIGHAISPRGRYVASFWQSRLQWHSSRAAAGTRTRPGPQPQSFQSDGRFRTRIVRIRASPTR